MDAAVAAVLNKFLGDWLENINSKELDISVFRGSVHLGPIKVRTEAIDKLGLPFQIRYGFVRRIDVEIDWLRLTSKPLLVTIEDAYILLATRPSDQWNEETVLKSQEARQKSRLKDFELLSAEAFTQLTEPGRFEKLVSTIVDNLQVRVSGLYVRLEDLTASIHPFAAAVSLGKLELLTCNSSWQPQYSDYSTVTYKRGTLDDFSIYLDYGPQTLLHTHYQGKQLSTAFETLAQKEVLRQFPGKHHFLVAPIAAYLQLTYTKDNEGFTKPVADVNFLLGAVDPLNLRVETAQLSHILKVVEFFLEFKQFQAGVLQRFHSKTWSQSEAPIYRSLYKAWKSDPSNALMDKLELMESGHNYEEITVQRSLSIKELEIERKERELQAEVEQYQEPSSGIVSGLKGFFGWGDREAEETERQHKLTQANSKLSAVREGRQRLITDFSSGAMDSLQAPQVPADYVQIKIVAKVPKVLLALACESQELLSGEHAGLAVNVFLRTGTVRVETLFGTMTVLDEVVKSLVFPYILKTGEFSCVFDQPPAGGPANLTLKAEKMMAIANFPCLSAIAQAIITSILDRFDIEHYKKVAGEKIAAILEAGEVYLTQFLEGNYTNSAIRLEAKVKAPCLIVPLEIREAGQCLVADFGEIEVNTDLARRLEGDLASLEEKFLYDFYKLTTRNVKFGTLWKFDDVTKWGKGSFAPLFEHPLLEVTLGNGIMKKIAKFPVILARVMLTELIFHLSTSQLLFLLRLQSVLMEQLSALQFNPQSPETSAVSERKKVRTGARLAAVEQVIAQHVEVSFSQLTCVIESNKGEVMAVEMKDMRCLLSVSVTKGVLLDLQVRDIEVKDRRPGAAFPWVVSKTRQEVMVSFDIGADPQFQYHDEKIAKGAVLETDAALFLRLKMSPKDCLLEALVSLSNMCLVLSCDFLQEMIQFPEQTFKVFSEETAKKSLAKGGRIAKPIAAIPRPSRPEPTATSKRVLQCILATVLLQELGLCLVVSGVEGKVVEVHLEGCLRYDSNRETEEKFDSQGNYIGSESEKISDEGVLDINKIGILVGYLRGNKSIEKASAVKDDLLMPTRLSVDYSCRKEAGPTVVTIDSDIESFDVNIGFRDLVVLKSILSHYLPLFPQASPPASPQLMRLNSLDNAEILQESSLLQQTHQLKVQIRLGSLEATLLDDTSLTLISLLYLELNNVSSSIDQSEETLSVDLSSGVRVKFYNRLTVCWEPVVEEWAFEVNAKQPDARTHVELRVASQTMLNVNLSYQMAETVSHVLKTLNLDPQEWSKEESIKSETSEFGHSSVIYKVKNHLGVTLQTWIEGGEVSSREVWTLEAGKSRSFEQSLVDRIRLRNITEGRKKYVSLMQSAQAASMIGLQIDTFQPVNNVVIEETMTRSMLLRSTTDSATTPFVVNISARKGKRVISLESLVKVLNNTALPLELLHRGRSLALPSGRAVPLPLIWLTTPSSTLLVTEKGQTAILSYTGFLDYSETVKIAVDYVVVQSGTTDIAAEVQIPHQKVIILNPACTIHNLTPGVLSMFREGSLEADFSLLPGAVTALNNVNPDKIFSQKWVVRLDQQRKVETQFFVPTKELQHERLSGDIMADRLTLERVPMSFVKARDWDLQLQTVVEEKWHGVGVQVYLQFWVVNKTQYALEFAGKRNTLVIPQESVGSVQDTKAQMTVRLPQEVYGQASAWSKPFNIRTVGIAGSLQLETAVPSATVPAVVQLGVKLQNAPWPLIKSVIVTIQPRFLITNYLDFPLYLRQYEREHTSTLQSKETAPYQLENSKLGKAIQVSCDQINWSSPFLLEDIDDLQIRFKSRVAEIGGYSEHDSRTWCRASPANSYYHYVRVIISTEDEATLFVSFTHPIDPEYVIWNMTIADISVCQVECAVITVVKPRARASFAYDNHLADKKVRLQFEGHSNQYTIEKLRESKRKLGDNRVKIYTEGVTRVVLIEPVDALEQAAERNSLEPILGLVESRFQNIISRISFLGCVFSFIDDFPCERLVFSMTDIRIKASQTIEPKLDSTKVQRALKVRIGNIQLDDMQASGPQFPVILGQHGLAEDTEDPVPFFQLRFELVTSVSASNEGENWGHFAEMQHFRHVGLLVQPIQVQIHQETVLGMLGVAIGLQAAFTRKQAAWEADSLQEIDFMKVCPSFSTSQPQLSYNAGQASSKAYFELVNLNSMKITVSFRSSRKPTTLKIDPREAFGLVSVIRTVGGAMLNISDSPLNFSNVILLHSFQTMQAMTWTIAKNYIRQGALQFYKVIGSSDMIGNPMGLIDKLGTGVFEFFNEPRKGLLKGPGAFATGVGKGVKSLVSGVVSGGFGSVSRITGSLYSVVRQVGGDENSYERINRNDTAAYGIYRGLKGGLQDLGEGVAGLFTKPFRGAKAGGVTGFFKGMGSGLLGLATAPLSAVLRVGTSVTSGIANSATLLRTGKIQQKGRVRFPRPFGARKVLEPYNEELAQAQEFLRTLKHFSDQQLVFYLRLDEATIVLITTNSALQIHNGEVQSSLPLSDIEACQVHWAQRLYILLVSGKKGNLVIKTEEYPGLARLFAVFSLTAKGVDPARTLPKALVAKAGRDRCCC